MLAFFLNLRQKDMRIYKKIAIVLLVSIFAKVGFSDVNSIHVSSRLDPNAIIITQVDIIFVYDQDLLNTFPSTKTAWYSNQRRFISEAGDKIDLISVFIPQGFDSETVSLPERSLEAVKIFVFSQHDDSEAPPIEISSFQKVLIEIDEFGILVSRQG